MGIVFFPLCFIVNPSVCFFLYSYIYQRFFFLRHTFCCDSLPLFLFDFFLFACLFFCCTERNVCVVYIFLMWTFFFYLVRVSHYLNLIFFFQFGTRFFYASFFMHAPTNKMSTWILRISFNVVMNCSWVNFTMKLSATDHFKTRT